MKTICWILCTSLYFCALHLAAQPSPDDFFVSGQARLVEENCFQLTLNDYWSSGGVWHKEPIDLNASFEMELKIMMGCDDAGGADGMVFVFTPFRGGGGYQGEGMGFAGLQPSLGIEIDTWENEHLGDPPEDHVAILRHGYVMHYYNLEGPVPIPNVEDCKLHKLQISWDSESQSLSIRLDDKDVISYTDDIVADIFYDNPKVYWGVTAATGKYINRHEICFERLEFASLLSKSLFSRVTQAKLVRGEVITLHNVNFEEGGSGLPRESQEELYKLINLLDRNPDLNITLDVHSNQESGHEANEEKSRIKVAELAAFLVKQGIDEKRIQARGLGSKYPLEEGSGSQDRVQVHLYRKRT